MSRLCMVSLVVVVAWVAVLISAVSGELADPHMKLDGSLDDPDRPFKRKLKDQLVKLSGVKDPNAPTEREQGYGKYSPAKANRIRSWFGQPFDQLEPGSDDWQRAWQSASKVILSIKGGKDIKILENYGIDPSNGPLGYGIPKKTKLAHHMDSDGKRINLPIRINCRGANTRVLGDIRKDDRCMVDFRNNKETNWATYANRKYQPGEDPNEMKADEVCTYKPSEKDCRAMIAMKWWMKETVSPTWDPPAKLDLIGAGVNSVQCEVYMETLKGAGHVTQRDDFIERDGQKLRRTQLGIFRVAPRDLAILPRDKDGYVSVPVIAESFRTDRRRLMGIKSFPFHGWTSTYLQGDEVGTVQVKLELDDFDEALIVRQGPPLGKLYDPTVPIRERWLNHGKCPMVFSHRGVRAPGDMENTPNSILKTISDPSTDGIEIDVFLAPLHVPENPKDIFDRKSKAIHLQRIIASGKKPRLKKMKIHRKDFDLVVFHDSSFQRLFNVDDDASTSIMSYLTPRVVNALRTETHCGEVLPTLDRILGVIKKFAPTKQIDLELKPGSPFEDPYKEYAKWMGRRVGEVIRKHGMEDNVIVSAFDHYKLVEVNKGVPKDQKRIRVAVATYKTWQSKVLNFFNWLSRKVIPSARVLHHSLITKELVDKYHKKNLPVGTYTMYNIEESSSSASHSFEEMSRLVDAGVDWIETDNPRIARRVLSELCRQKGLVSREDIVKWNSVTRKKPVQTTEEHAPPSAI
eukprot:TRINITY_DN7218_c0_g1_i1.p1 TRINITY_DN7218_c0_g1~~TRINITY_DN7218_c0_g1_i1.p1  ORF type:complete len:781 (-),score=169.09 TRINITY_DN7218_c0_g1_i1:88-2319(-)